jgi:cobalt/nickel transport system ATP-binding protein
MELRGVAFRYPDGSVGLSRVDLSVFAGERVAVLGPNGAGKTTLALHLDGLLTPSGGAVLLDGQALADVGMSRVRSAVGLVFQDPDDQLFMPTVGQDVAFGPRNFGMSPDEVRRRVDEALTAVDMADHADDYPGHLSFGQKRRVAIATVLACGPRVLVLDEPTSNLDPRARRRLAEVLDRLPVTQIVITHDLPFAAQTCPRAVVLDAGRVVADGPTAEILSDQDFLEAHRLELPYGFDPGALRH